MLSRDAGWPLRRLPTVGCVTVPIGLEHRLLTSSTTLTQHNYCGCAWLQCKFSVVCPQTLNPQLQHFSALTRTVLVFSHSSSSPVPCEICQGSAIRYRMRTVWPS